MRSVFQRPDLQSPPSAVLMIPFLQVRAPIQRGLPKSRFGFRKSRSVRKFGPRFLSKSLIAAAAVCFPALVFANSQKLPVWDHSLQSGNFATVSAPTRDGPARLLIGSSNPLATVEACPSVASAMTLDNLPIVDRFPLNSRIENAFNQRSRNTGWSRRLSTLRQVEVTDLGHWENELNGATINHALQIPLSPAGR